MIVGTAGHIDHGKTSLVRALSGVDTDRLPEEKARGITLDLGFAYVKLPDGGVLGFVDVPGHERLVHTMIAGAASIGMALLVVAADDGVMPQTREHLQILSLLGVTKGVVALTKTDLVDEDRLFEVELEITELLEGSSLDGADIFPVSSATNAGIDALRDRLMTEAMLAQAAADDGRAFRLAVDRSFSLAGAGTVVTGSVVAGTVRTNDAVLLLPSGLRARVRGIHAANQTVTQAGAGERCALNLTGPGVHKDVVGRGDWVMDPAQDAMAMRCDAAITVLASERGALRSGTPILLHHGAEQVTGRVVVLDPAALAPGDSGLVHLILDRPRPLRHGDRLVLRDASATRTIAGGRVLDPRPPARHRRAPARLALLHALEAGQGLEAVLSAPPYLLRRAVALADWGLTEARLPDAVTLGDIIASPDGLATLTQAATGALAAFHTQQPNLPGASAEALRIATVPRLPRDAFAALVAHLQASRAVLPEGHLWRLPTHQGGLRGAEAKLWESLRRVLEEDPSRPPFIRDAATAIGAQEVALRRASKNFSRLGLVVELAPDRFFLRDAAVALGEAAHAVSAEVPDGWFTAAQYRDRIGIGRGLAIQVLDYFDRRGVTVRRGDLRKAGKPVEAVLGPAGA
jgi:selenocysteine-specific elongation factor